MRMQKKNAGNVNSQRPDERRQACRYNRVFPQLKKHKRQLAGPFVATNPHPGRTMLYSQLLMGCWDIELQYGHFDT